MKAKYALRLGGNVTLRRSKQAEYAAILETSTPRSLPRTRADCADIPRPCPYVSCRHNNYLEVTKVGSIKLNYDDPEDVPSGLSCSLDLADEGEHKIEDIGHALGITKQAAEQVEETAMSKLKSNLQLAQIWQDYEPTP